MRARLIWSCAFLTSSLHFYIGMRNDIDREAWTRGSTGKLFWSLAWGNEALDRDIYSRLDLHCLKEYSAHRTRRCSEHTWHTILGCTTQHGNSVFTDSNRINLVIIDSFFLNFACDASNYILPLTSTLLSI